MFSISLKKAYQKIWKGFGKIARIIIPYGCHNETMANELVFFVTCSLDYSDPDPMKITLLILATLIMSVTSASGQSNLYVWSEINPAWKTNSLKHWSEIKGYGKVVPEEMAAIIREYHENAEKRLNLALRQGFLNSELPILPVLTENPGSIFLSENDLFLDLQCSLAEVSEIYPNFRKRKIKIEPLVRYNLTLYGPDGSILIQKQYLDTIDYKNRIRPSLTGMPEHRRDIEIVKKSYLESFSDEVPVKLISDLANDLKNKPYSLNRPDPDKFQQVVGLLFENRKISYPLEYQSVHFITQNLSPSTTGHRQKTDGANQRNNNIYDDLERLIDGSRYFALIIGVNEYHDPLISNLSEPLRDAELLMSTLTENYNFREEHIRLMENPTRNELIQALDELAHEVKKNDNLLIFYAGHGLWDDQLKKGFWIPADARTDNRANWFSNADLRDYMGGIPAKHTLLISDACFSGGIFKTREVFSSVTPATVELYKLPSRKAMTSGAMTTVPDKSVFIEFLIKRLNENTNPVLSAEQLFASFKIAVINNSPTRQVPQFGEIRETGDEGGDFLFIRKMNK